MTVCVWQQGVGHIQSMREDIPIDPLQACLIEKKHVLMGLPNVVCPTDDVYN